MLLNGSAARDRVQKSNSQGNSKSDFGVNYQTIFAPKVSKEALLGLRNFCAKVIFHSVTLAYQKEDRLPQHLRVFV